MGTVYGYARVSTARQKLDRQIENIKKEQPDAVIFAEKIHGNHGTTPRMAKALPACKARRHYNERPWKHNYRVLGMKLLTH